jgi:hypothetical protein
MREVGVKKKKKKNFFLIDQKHKTKAKGKEWGGIDQLLGWC